MDNITNLIKKYKLEIACGALVIAIAIVGIILSTQLFSKVVYLDIDGQVTKVKTNSFRVEGFLEEQHIEVGKRDSLEPGTNKILTDGSHIVIKRAIPFNLQADGKNRTLRVIPMTIAEALKVHNIEYDGNDIITPAPETEITEGMQVVLQRVKVKTKTVEEEIPYTTVVQEDENLEFGIENVTTPGVNGLDKVKYQITYTDGVETARAEISRETIEAMVQEVIVKGTAGTIHGKPYSRKFTVKAYSYTGGGRTASGKPAAVGRIAVDRRVIPLGTKVYVEGYGFAEAADTGGNIKGNTIDVYFNSRSECINWGARNVTVYILK